jgi:flagellar protein FlaG
MDIQGVTISSGRARADNSVAADEIKDKRLAQSHSSIVENVPDSDDAKNTIQAEELIQNIKSLAKDGLYSVRFEIDDATQDLVINLIDQESGEVIRQVPSEEILGTRQFLADLRGNLVETES